MPKKQQTPPVSRPPQQTPDVQQQVLDAINQAAGLSVEARVALYNEAVRTLAALVADVAPDPVLAVQLVPTAAVRANDYNPNTVAAPEVDLLELSIRADGLTMPIVTVVDPATQTWVVVDGFHRHTVLATRLQRPYAACTVIDRSLADRMAATVRHNRARGKHQIDLMATLVKQLLGLGWEDPAIAQHLGMSAEELLRLKQSVGVAPLLASTEYSQSWGRK